VLSSLIILIRVFAPSWFRTSRPRAYTGAEHEVEGPEMSIRKRDTPPEEQIQRLLEELEEATRSDEPQRVVALADQLWASRRAVVPVLVDRLTSGKTTAPLVLLQLLPTFAGSGARQQLSKVARDTRTADIVRFSARRRLGWPERGEAKARVAFVSSLRDGVATLVEALDTLRGAPYPLGGETLEEVLKYLLVMPSAQAREVVTLGVRMMGRQIAWLLRALLHAREPSLRDIALDGILEIGDPGATAAMERASKISGHPDFASRVKDATQRLVSEQQATEGMRSAEPLPLPPIHSTYLSAIDGGGGQVAIAVRRQGESLMVMSQFYLQEGWGVKDTLGLENLPWEAMKELYETWGDRLDALRGEREGEEIPLVEVDASALRGALAQAERINLATNHRFPREFEIWEPLLHDQDPPASDEPVVTPELDDTGYLDRDDLYRRSDELLQHRLFGSWLFEPAEVASVLEKSLPPAASKLTVRQFRPIIDALLDDVTRRGLRDRLRRQAWLLRHSGDEEEAEIALAAAAGLAEGHPSELARHPLLQQMVLFGLTPLMGLHIRLG
jgi:hypothetical protein